MVFLEIISQLCNFNPRSREGSDFLYFSSFSMPALNFNPRSREGSDGCLPVHSYP